MSSFPEACASELAASIIRVYSNVCAGLCDEVLRAGRVTAGDRVLDVGHACGDSLLHIISQPPSYLPMSVVGVTSLPIHHARASIRVDEALSAMPEETRRPKVRLFLGDAIYRHSSSPNHPFKPLAATDPLPFDKILALDCAYHFETRKIFFEQAFAHLSPGGRIALADICLPAVSKSLIRRVLDSTGVFMPKENMWTIDEYEAQLRRVGFRDVTVQDITDYVFPGFLSFLQSKGWRWWLTERVVATYVTDGARFVLASAEKP